MEWRVESSTSKSDQAAGETAVLTHRDLECVELMQTAFFAPRGLPGFLYWYLIAPLHCIVFRGLIRAIKQRSENRNIVT